MSLLPRATIHSDSEHLHSRMRAPLESLWLRPVVANAHSRVLDAHHCRLNAYPGAVEIHHGVLETLFRK